MALTPSAVQPLPTQVSARGGPDSRVRQQCLSCSGVVVRPTWHSCARPTEHCQHGGRPWAGGHTFCRPRLACRGMACHAREAVAFCCPPGAPDACVMCRLGPQLFRVRLEPNCIVCLSVHRPTSASPGPELHRVGSQTHGAPRRLHCWLGCFTCIAQPHGAPNGVLGAAVWRPSVGACSHHGPNDRRPRWRSLRLQQRGVQAATLR